MAHLNFMWKHSKLATLSNPPVVSDGGHGRDIICPIVYYGQLFDPEVERDLVQLSEYVRNELIGYQRCLLLILDGEFAGETLAVEQLPDQKWILHSPNGEIVVIPQGEPTNGEDTTFFIDGSSGFTATVTSSWLDGVGCMTVNLSEISSEPTDCGSNPTYESRVRVFFVIRASMNNGPQLADQYCGYLARLFRGVRFKANASASAGTLEKDMADSQVSVIYHSAAREALEER